MYGRLRDPTGDSLLDTLYARVHPNVEFCYNTRWLPLLYIHIYIYTSYIYIYTSEYIYPLQLNVIAMLVWENFMYTAYRQNTHTNFEQTRSIE